MNKSEITKNLNQIKKLLEEDSPYIAKERIKWLISDIEKGRQYRSTQGRNNKKYSDSMKIVTSTYLIFGIVIIGAIIYGIFTNG